MTVLKWVLRKLDLAAGAVVWAVAFWGWLEILGADVRIVVGF